MARFGLSPYSNPVQSGIESYATLNRVFNDNDRVEMDKQDSALRRDVTTQNLARSRQEQEWAEQDRPAVEAKNNAIVLAARQKPLHQALTKGMIKTNLALSEGRQAEYDVEDMAAVLVLQEDAVGYKNDEDGALQQAMAFNNLNMKLSEIAPKLAEAGKTQKKMRVGNKNIPGVMDDVNIAFSEYFGGNTAESMILDLEQGVMVPVMQNEDGSTKLLTKEDGAVASIPIDTFMNLVNYNGQFGSHLIATYGQLNGNDALMKEVLEAKKEMRFNMDHAEALDQIPEGTPPAEARKKYSAFMAKKNHKVESAALDKLFPKANRTGLGGKATVINGKQYYMDDEGNATNMEVPPKETDPLSRELKEQRLTGEKEKRVSKETAAADKMLAGEYAAEALSNTEEPIDKNNVDAVISSLPAEKRPHVKALREEVSRLIEAEGLTAAQAVKKARDKYVQDERERKTHSQRGSLNLPAEKGGDVNQRSKPTSKPSGSGKSAADFRKK